MTKLVDDLMKEDEEQSQQQQSDFEQEFDRELIEAQSDSVVPYVRRTKRMTH